MASEMDTGHWLQTQRSRHICRSRRLPPRPCTGTPTFQYYYFCHFHFYQGVNGYASKRRPLTGVKEAYYRSKRSGNALLSCALSLSLPPSLSLSIPLSLSHSRALFSLSLSLFLSFSFSLFLSLSLSLFLSFSLSSSLFLSLFLSFFVFLSFSLSLSLLESDLSLTQKDLVLAL